MSQIQKLLTHRGYRQAFFYSALSGLGLIVGILWFLRNLRLPVYSRGIMCCDAAHFLWLSTQEIQRLVFHLSERTFGYPLYLASFRWIYSYSTPDAGLTAACVTQFALSIVGATVMFLGIRSTGLKIPLLCYALLLSHPALAGIAAVPLTDSLASSLASMFIGIVAFLCANQRYLWVKSLLLGFLAGIILSIRPPSTTFMIIWTLLVFIMVVSGVFLHTRNLVATLKALCVAVIFYALGFLPVGGHLLNNCYAAHKTLCVIDPGVAKGPLAGSLNLSYQYSRAWGSVDPVKSWAWHFTEDRVLRHCSFSYEDPFGSLKGCYLQNISRLPLHLLNRTIGLFDYRHLNPYAALETTPTEFWTLRIFAAVSFIGLITTIVFMIYQLYAGSLIRYGFLLLPLSCFAIQVNLHTENRYLLSAIPSFFIFGAATIFGRILNRGWPQLACLGLAAILLTYGFYHATIWDATSLKLTGSR